MKTILTCITVLLWTLLTSWPVEGVEKVLESETVKVCSNDTYEYCPSLGACLSTKTCRLESVDSDLPKLSCPDNHLLCQHPLGNNNGCYAKACKDTIEPCTTQCQKIANCTSPADEPSACRDYIICKRDCPEEGDKATRPKRQALTGDEEAEEESAPACDVGATHCSATGQCSVAAECSGERCGELEFSCKEKDQCISQEICREGEQKGFWCPAGTAFCLDSRRCLASCGEDGGPQTHCPSGEGFCPALGGCIPWDNDCPEEEVLVSKCYERGEIFCMQTGTCAKRCNSGFSEEDDDDEEEEILVCKSGTVFCMSTGRCVKPGQCGRGRPGEEEIKVETCPPESVFCMEQGRCVPKGCDHAEPREELEVEEPCPPGTLFCLGLGGCVPPGQCRPGEEDDGQGQAVVCPRGTQFCLQSHSCAKTCEEAAQEQQEEPYLPPEELVLTCPAGTVFCMESGSCALVGDCGRKPNSADGSSDTRDDEVTRCPKGHVYCMTIDACVLGDCSMFDRKTEDVTQCPSGEIFDVSSGHCKKHFVLPQKSLNVKCRSGEVYCADLNMCLSVMTPCPDRRCPWGTLYCEGRCQPECSTEAAGCPALSDMPHFEYSTCTIHQQCGEGHKCCRGGTDFHKQCVTETSAGLVEAADPGADLKRSCEPLATGDLLKLEEETCTEDPKECRKDTLCCEGQCRGLPEIEREYWSSSSKHCIIGESYCDITGECLKSSEWSQCACPEDLLLCRYDTSNENFCATQCPEGSSTGHILIAPNRVVRVGAEDTEDAGFSVSSLIPPERLKQLQLKSTKKALEVTDPGSEQWEKKNKKDSDWSPLKEGDVLGLPTLVRLDSPAASRRRKRQTDRARVATFKVKALTKGNSQETLTVSQLVFPDPLSDLDPPVFNTDDLAYEMKEDSEEAIPISGILTPVETERTKAILLKEYKHAYENLLASGSSAFYLEQESSPAQWLFHVFEGDSNGAMLQRPMGVELELADPPKRKHSSRVRIGYSLDSGDSWRTLKKLQDTLKLPLKDSTMLRLRTEADFSGEIRFRVRAFAQELDGQIQLSPESETTMSIKIVPVNDRPHPLYSTVHKARALSVPYNISSDDAYDGFAVRELVHMYYSDRDFSTASSNDNEGLGMALLAAPRTKLGRWQIKHLDSDAEEQQGWQDVDGILQEGVDTPEALLVGIHEGPVPIEDFMDVLVCGKKKIRNDDTSLTTPENAFYWNEFRESCESTRAEKKKKSASKEKKQGKTSKLSKTTSASPSSKRAAAAKRSSRRGLTLALEQLDASLSSGGDEEDSASASPTAVTPTTTMAAADGVAASNVVFSSKKKRAEPLETQLVSALLLPPLTRLRFMPDDPHAQWTSLEAVDLARIAFTAWDRTSEEKAGDTVDIELPYCIRRCGPESSFSRDFSYFSMSKLSCDGSAVVSLQDVKSVDKCGICGGNNSVCTDCSGELHGEKIFVCERCVSDVSSVLDCASVCGGNNVWQADEASGQQVCVNKAENGHEILPCDGVKGSDAVINVCGICILGNTGRTQQAGMDKCGVCITSNAAVNDDAYTDETKDCPCGLDVDLCGLCREKGSEEWNDCHDAQKSLWTNPSVSDKIGSENLYVEFIQASVAPEDGEEATCSLYAPNGQLTLSSARSRVNPGSIEAYFVNPPMGTYKVTCSFLGQKWSTAREEDHWTIVDTSHLDVLEARAVKSTATSDAGEISYNLVIDLAEPLKAFEQTRLTCFCRIVNGPQRAEPFPVVKVDPTNAAQVQCGRLPFNGGNEYECGVTLTAHSDIFKRPLLPSANVVIKSQAPKVKLAELVSESRAVHFEFDRNVQSTATCKEIFTEDTLRVLDNLEGDGECYFRANRLRVNAGADTTLPELALDAKIRFRPGNGIVVRGSKSEYAEEVQSDTDIKLALGQPSKEQNKGTKPSFRLWHLSQLCREENLIVDISRLYRMGSAGDTIYYNITRLATRNGRVIEGIASSRTLVLSSQYTFKSSSDDEEASPKNSPGRRSRKRRSAKRRAHLELSTNELESGVDYEVSALAVTASANSEAKTSVFLIADSDQDMTVNIIGPTSPTMYADRTIPMRAKVTLCNQLADEEENDAVIMQNSQATAGADDGAEETVAVGEAGKDDDASSKKKKRRKAKNKIKKQRKEQREKESRERYKYYWSTDGPIDMDLSAQDTPRIRVPSGALQGGRNYSFYVSVVPELRPDDSVTSRVATKSLTFGTETEIVLVGTLSRDLDNRQEPLEYRWTCTNSEKNPCYALNDDGITKSALLKDKFANELQQGRVVLPPRTLSAGNYVFALTVSKGRFTDTANVTVEIRPGKVATFELTTRDVMVNARKETVVKALVNGSPGTCVQWTSDRDYTFESIDLEAISKSGQLTCFSGPVESRGFHLVLPPDSLKSAAKYQFTLTATKANFEGTSSVSTIIHTMLLPESGQCQVEPSYGLAMNTSFSIDCSGFMSESISDHDFLTYTYFYRIVMDDDERSNYFYLDELDALEAEASMEALLPAGYMEVLVEVCNPYLVCVEYLIDEIVEVVISENDEDLEASVTEESVMLEKLKDTSYEAAALIAQKDYLAALSLVKRITLTVDAMASPSELMVNALCSLELNMFLQVNDAYMAQLERSQIGEASEALKIQRDSSCITRDTADDTRKAEQTDALSSRKAMAQKVLQVMIYGSEYEGASVVEGRRRRRRSLPEPESVEDEGKNPILTLRSDLVRVEFLELMLSLTEQQTEASLEEMTELWDELRSIAMPNMCKLATPQSSTTELHTQSINANMAGVDFDTGGDTGADVVQFPDSKSQLKFSSAFVSKFNSWFCHDKPFPCVGLVVGTVDSSSETNDEDSEDVDGTLISDGLEFRFYNPHSCNEFFDATEPVNLSMGVTKQQFEKAKAVTESSDSFTLKCVVKHENKLYTDVCNTDNVETYPDGTAKINCQCSLSGKVSVYMVKVVNGTEELILVPKLKKLERIVEFTIDMAYEVLVGDDKAGFLERLKGQLVTLLVTTASNIEMVDARSGSTIVTVKVISYDEEEAEQLNTKVDDLVELFQEGKVTLVDENGTPLPIPAQCVQLDGCSGPEVVKAKTEEETVTIYIIVALAAAVVFFIILFVICAIYHKNKKREEKIKPTMHGTGSLPPTYRSFHFAESLEGTNINRYRGKPLPGPYTSGPPPYMPTTPTYSRQGWRRLKNYPT